jgi:hypothetical protein
MKHIFFMVIGSMLLMMFGGCDSDRSSDGNDNGEKMHKLGMHFVLGILT